MRPSTHHLPHIVFVYPLVIPQLIPQPSRMLGVGSGADGQNASRDDSMYVMDGWQFLSR